MHEIIIDIEPAFNPRQNWHAIFDKGDSLITAQCEQHYLEKEPGNRFSEKIINILNNGIEYRERDNIGRDGIHVKYKISSKNFHFDEKIWCPDSSISPQLMRLTKVFWQHLHGENTYLDIQLERFISYFDECSPPLFKTKNGIKISGMWSPSHKDVLEDGFLYASAKKQPVIDMTAFEHMGTILLPVFKNFSEKNPHAKWIGGEAAYYFLSSIGIDVERKDKVT